MRIAFIVLAWIALVSGCAGGDSDHRFLTPEATVRSLFIAYGIEDIPEAAIVARMQEGGRFALEDASGYRACFADFRGPSDEGLAGYVFGALAAGKDHLRYERDGDLARVYPGSGEAEGAPRITLRREAEQWKIVLRESVPAEARERLFEIYGRAREHEARSGAPR